MDPNKLEAHTKKFQELSNMTLGEWADFGGTGTGTRMLRVPGGWVLHQFCPDDSGMVPACSAVFVPLPPVLGFDY